MLAIFLGSSTFPKSPQLPRNESFCNSANDLMKYLKDERCFGMPDRNLLNLFDDPRAPSQQLEAIAEFLVQETQRSKKLGPNPEDLLIYYVGHGLFTSGSSFAYCLALQSTNEKVGGTSLRACDLADVVKTNADYLRRYMIIDCCFAASIFNEFQAAPITAARKQIKDMFPERGTALLCASNSREPARAPEALRLTMFSSALLKALRKGHPAEGPQLSFYDLGRLINHNVRRSFPKTYVRPEVHSPDQREGDIAQIPLFPNPGYCQPKPASIDRRPMQKVQEEEKPVHEAQKLSRADISVQNRLAAQEAAADRILQRSKRMREQARKRRLLAMKPTVLSNSRLTGNEQVVPTTEKGEDVLYETANPSATVSEKLEPVASTSAGIKFAMTLASVGFGILGVYVGSHWASYASDSFYRSSSFFQNVLIAGIMGFLPGLLWGKTTKVLKMRRTFLCLLYGFCPGFLFGYFVFNKLPTDSQPPASPAIGIIAGFLCAAWTAYDTK